MRKLKTKTLIKRLRKAGVTKYHMAKETGVTWHCVHFWEKGWWEASPYRKEILTKLLENDKK